MIVKNNNSVIINICSQAGKIWQAEDKIKVAVINPGSTNSPFHDKREKSCPGNCWINS